MHGCEYQEVSATISEQQLDEGCKGLVQLRLEDDPKVYSCNNLKN